MKEEDEEIYVNQPIIDHYNDFHEIGQWGSVEIQEDGTYKVGSDGGKMLSETVKFIGEDGKIKLGNRWIPDNHIKNE